MARISMKDVAKHAGVSVATVSHVVNQSKFVSVETAQKVQRSIEALHFRPDPIARNFKTGRSHMIAFVVPDIANSFFSTLISEIETSISAHGYQLLIINTKEDSQKELPALKKMESGLVDAIIIATAQFDYAPLKEIILPQLPHLFIDRKLPGCPHDSAVTSTKSALTEGIERLIAKGHQKIGFIAGIDYPYLKDDRIQTYIDIMKSHDLYNAKFIIHAGVMGLNTLVHLDTLIHERCTAIVCGNNVLSIATYNLLMEKGIMPGKEIELIGFRESNVKQYGLKFMNLIVQPTTSLGIAAAEQILSRLDDPDQPIRDIILPAEYIPQEQVPQKFYLPY